MLYGLHYFTVALFVPIVAWKAKVI